MLNSSGTVRHGLAPVWVCEHDSLHSPRGCSIPDAVFPLFILGLNQIWGTLNHFKLNYMSFPKREGTKPCFLSPSEDQKMAFMCAGLSRFQPAPSPEVLCSFALSLLQGSFARLLLFGFFLSQLPLVFLLFFHNPPGAGQSPSAHGVFVRGCLCSEQ